jgi:hypothetical protein
MRKGPRSAFDKWKISVVILTQIFQSCQPCHGGILEVMTSPLPNGTLVAVASVLAATSIKEILIGATSSGISYHLRNIYSIYRCWWNGATYKLKVHNGILKHLNCHNVSFLTAPHCRIQGVNVMVYLA